MLNSTIFVKSKFSIFLPVNGHLPTKITKWYQGRWRHFVISCNQMNRMVHCLHCNVLKLQKAVKSGERDEWNNYIESLEDRDEVQIRDLFTLPEGISEITNKQDPELLNDIYKRFTISSMSLGALSEEAHQALAIGINKLGGKSGSGEGGEDPKRFGTEKNSKIKQIASGRFGVTPDYLASAEEFQIKMAQGSKPGEGGQLPGFKVDSHIAKLRHTKSALACSSSGTILATTS